MATSSLSQKVALVTGATSGIGKSIAISLAKEGCYLSITGRNETALQEVKQICCEAGLLANKVLAVPGDLSKDEDCKRIVSATIDHFQKLNILINNAGILVRGSLEELSIDDFDKQLNINTRSVFLMMKLALPHILATKGNIVNVSSNLSIKPIAGYLAYNVSKAAVDQLTRSVALEVAERGVRVNSVNPAVIVTEVHKRAGMDEAAYQKFLEHAKSLHPIGRVGQVEEVSRAVIFLASDHASFITGVTLLIDGGSTIA
ncbi:cyclohexanol dehydrogenase-like [Palaemon carinicauda]|uniref:cyclohexanol dehydrogenase-like n=1 Tax=Palaemon carinicauda TaxID=392227 RepID=UPI0035B657B8